MKDKIKKLRSEGKTYNEIKEILGCSKGTIAYHCGVGQKEKTINRKNSYLKTLRGILKRKKDNFACANDRRIGPGRRIGLEFSSSEFKDKIESNLFCYLSGRPIDILSPKTYQCDHIVPVNAPLP